MVLKQRWYSIKKINKILRKDKMVKRANSLLDKLDYEDKDEVKNMIRITEKCKDMAAFI